MRRFFIVLAVIAGISILPGFWLLNTADGLRWFINLAGGFAPGELEIKEIAGRAVGPVRLRGIDYRDGAGNNFRAATLEFDWQPMALLQKRLHIDFLTAAELTLDLAAGGEDEAAARQQETTLPELRLPIAVLLDDIRVSDLRIRRDGSDAYVIERAQFLGRWDDAGIQIDRLELEERRGTLALRGGLRPWDGYPFNATVDGRFPLEGRETATATLSLNGNSEHLDAAFSVRGPVDIDGEARIDAPLEAPRWQGKVDTIAPLQLRRIDPGWPDIEIAGQLSGEGSLEQATLELQTTRPAQAAARVALGPFNNDLRWQADIDTPTPFPLRNVDPGWPEIEITGRLSGEGSLEQATLELQTTRPAQAAARVALGPFNNDLRWQADIDFPTPFPLRNVDPGWPDIEIAGRLSGEGSLDQATLELQTTRPAQAAAHVALGPFNNDLRWQAGLETREPLALNTLGAHWPALALSGEASAAGDLELAEVSTRLRAATAEQSVDIRADVKVSRSLLLIDRLTLAGVDMPARAEFSGRLDLSQPSMPFNGRGNWQDLHWPLLERPRWTSSEGTFTAEGDLDKLELALEGTLDAVNGERTEGQDNRLSLQISARDLRDTPRLTAQALVPYLAVPDLELRELDAKLQLDLTDLGPSFADVTIGKLRVSGQEITRLALTGSGTSKRHALKLEAGYGGSAVLLAADGAYLANQWQGRITRLEATEDTAGSWALQQPAPLGLAADSVSLEDLCLANGDAVLCAAGEWAARQGWRGSARLEQLPMALIGPLWRSDFTWEGELFAELELSGGGGQPLTGNAKASVPAGSISWVFDGEENRVAYRDLEVSGDISEAQAMMRLAGHVGDDGSLAGRAVVTRPFDSERERPLDGELSLDLPSLSLLEVFLPDLHFHQGAMTLRTGLAGSMEKPLISGDARIEDAQIDLKALGIGVRDLGLHATLVEGNRLRIAGSGASGQGSLNIDGEGRLLDVKDWSIELRARGQQVEALNLPEAHLVASPDLTVGITAKRVDISGEVHIDEAQLKPELATAGVTLSPDVVVESTAGAKEESSPKPVHASVRMTLGDRVRLDSYGMKADLTGQLEIAHAPGRVTTGNGEIVLRNGSYSIYGRSLTIDPGRLVFTGGPVDDPGLDVRAIRTAGDVTAGVLVTGTARAPEVTLFSEPSMPDSEKLSYLLLGRPTSQANKEEGAVLLQAALAMLPGGAGGAGGVGSDLQSRLGIDSVSIESNGGDEQGRLLVLGKYLSPRLFVSWGAGVAGALNVFRVRYELSRRWLLTSETSSRESSGDILYSLER